MWLRRRENLAIWQCFTSNNAEKLQGWIVADVRRTQNLLGPCYEAAFAERKYREC